MSNKQNDIYMESIKEDLADAIESLKFARIEENEAKLWREKMEKNVEQLTINLAQYENK